MTPHDDTTLIKRLSTLRKEMSEGRFQAIEARIMERVRSSPLPRLSFWKSFFIFNRIPSMPLLLALALFFGLSGGTVLAAQNDMPGEVLYPVKLWSEAARERLTFTPEKKIELLLQFHERRIAELEWVEGQGGDQRVNRERVIGRLSSQLAHMETVMDRVSRDRPDRALEAGAKAEARLKAVAWRLREIDEGGEADEQEETIDKARKEVDEKIESSRQALEAAERNASPQGWERSATGFFGALENKAVEVGRQYEKVKEGGALLSEELTGTYSHAKEKMTEAKTYLESEKYRESFLTTKESFRFFIETQRLLNQARRASGSENAPGKPEESSRGASEEARENTPPGRED
ncbi:hypothetical protein HY628_02945 [Candidatus Uhrbacteria bacterium]|nr:hypothetical protein [Candidatus Uhrbacteria bacterium]